MTLHIDGTLPDGSLDGGPCGRAPWAIFDDERQDWIRAGIRWHWLAQLIVCRMTNLARSNDRRAP